MNSEKLRVLKKIRDRLTSIRDDLYAVIDETINALTPGKYEDENLPGAPGNGAILFDTDRGLPTWYDRDHYEWPNFVDDVLVVPQTVSNTTTRTEVWNPDINAGSLVKGRTYQVDLMGKFTTASTSDDFTVHVNLAGATDVAEIQSSGQNVSEDPWSVELTFTVREDGQNGVIAAHTKGIFNSEPDDNRIDPISVDTTTATELSVDLSWNNAKAGNTVTLEQAHIKQMG